MKKLFSGIVLIGLAFAAASCVKMDINNLFSGNHEADFDIIGTYESAGYVQPAAYQEIASWDQKTDNSKYTTVLSVTEDKMILTFPGGGFREVGYTMDKEKKTFSFDKPFIYKSKYYEGKDFDDILSCSYRLEAYEAKGVMSYYIVFFRLGSKGNKMDVNKGDWKVTFQLEVDPKNGSKPVMPIEGEYGTIVKPVDFGFSSKRLWAAEPVANGIGFEKPDADIAAAYYGPKYTLPSLADGEELISSTNIKYVEYTHGTFVAFADNSYMNYVALPCTESMKTGLWLNDGSAIICEVDPKTYKVSAHIEKPVYTTRLCITPIVK